MKEMEHLNAAEEFWRVAENSTQLPVRVQAYFYAAINFIEAMLAKTDKHSTSHEDRAMRMIESGLFSAEEFHKYQDLVAGRNLAGYVGKNGGRCAKIRAIAEYFRNKARGI